MQTLLFGIADAGIQHASHSPIIQIEEKFSLVKSAGVFDYIEATPIMSDVAEYERCSQVYDLPILAGSRNYILGLQEHELAENLRIGASLGSKVHNTQVFMDHANGHLVSNDEVMRCYLDAYELGINLGCMPVFETHVNMWSEKFSRVLEVAKLVEDRGVPFAINLDHSHVIFKLNNPVELAVFGVDELINKQELVLNPFDPDNEIAKWINSGLVAHAHARGVAMNNPKNIAAQHPDIHNLRSSLHPKNTVGRGIQYPFTKPNQGEWHGNWQESDLDTWKTVVKDLMTFHATNKSSPLQMITAEYIPFTDYGEGSTYSLLEHNTACVTWLRQQWQNFTNQK